MRQLLKALLIAAALVLLIKAFVLTSCTIPSAGMENTLYQGDRVIISKWSYGLRLPLLSWIGCHRWGERPVRRGDILLFNNPSPDDDRLPIDRRELFINRCIGLPGDTLMLNNRLIQTEDRVLSPDSKLLYAYPGESDSLVVQAMRRAGIRQGELMGMEGTDFLRSFSHYEMYKLTQELGDSLRFRSLQTDTSDGVHPYVIPARGLSVKVYPWNVRLLCNTIARHEGRTAEVRGDTLLVDGRPVSAYTFRKDYHWVASNNSVSLCDSRLFGFVPHDHLIGRAVAVWFSKNPDAPLWKGYRWRRFFKPVH